MRFYHGLLLIILAFSWSLVKIFPAEVDEMVVWDENFLFPPETNLPIHSIVIQPLSWMALSNGAGQENISPTESSFALEGLPLW